MSAFGSQPVRFPCPSCGRILSADEILRGTEQLCPHCRKLIPVPAKSEEVHAPPPVQTQGSSQQEIRNEQPGSVQTESRPVSNGTEEDEMWGPGEAAPAQQQTYVPVHCRVCDTRMYATTEQVGSEIVCPDCGAKTKVKMVANKITTSAPPMMAGDAYELSEPPPLLTMETLGYGSKESRVKGSAYDPDSLAATAKAEHAIRHARNNPPKDWMLRGVFLYPLQISVISNSLMIASLCVGVLYLTRWIYILGDIQFVAVIAVVMVLIDAAFANFAGAYLGTLLIAVIEVASDGQDNIADEFEMLFVDRLYRFLFIVSAWVCAAAPGALIDLLAGAPEAWQLALPVRLSLLTAFSLFVFLPWTQLSVLETSSLVVPVSYQVIRSAVRKPLAWVAFYLMSLLVLSIAAGLIFLASYLFRFAAWWLSLWIAVIALVIYYRLLGRLAWYCAANIDPLEQPKSADPYEPLYP